LRKRILRLRFGFQFHLFDLGLGVGQRSVSRDIF
jgi:hypothetical protein